MARQFEFVPNEILVKRGQNVRRKITSQDVTCGFALPDFGINEVLNPGEKITVEFQASKAGEFDFFCSVSCGSGHAGMRSKLIVVE